MKLIRVHCHTDIDKNTTEYRLEYHPNLINIFEELGIIENLNEGIRYEDLHRLEKILRLKKNCGVNTVGASIIVDLLEKIEHLQDEVERLRRK